RTGTGGRAVGRYGLAPRTEGGTSVAPAPSGADDVAGVPLSPASKAWRASRASSSVSISVPDRSTGAGPPARGTNATVPPSMSVDDRSSSAGFGRPGRDGPDIKHPHRHEHSACSKRSGGRIAKPFAFGRLFLDYRSKAGSAIGQIER